MEASPPNRASGSAGRLISGSPRSTRPLPGNGRRVLPRRIAAMLPAKLRCEPISRHGRELRQEASGRCAMPGIAAWRTCTRRGSRSSSTRRSTSAPSWPALHEVLRDRRAMSCPITSACGEDEMRIDHSSRLRRPAVFPARLFRLQAGPAVRLFEVLARRRRQPAAVLRLGGIQELPRPGRAAVLAASFGNFLRVVADGVHSGTGRTRATDDNTDYYPVAADRRTLRPGTVYADPYGHVLCRATRAADATARRRPPRGGRTARRHRRAQALLARQLPLRAGSRARQPGLQALPSDRARQERRAAAAHQRRDREEPGLRRFLARADTRSASRASTTRWTT